MKRYNGNRTGSSIFSGTLVAIGLSVLIAVLLSAAIQSEKISEKAVVHFALAGQFISCLAGFILAGKIAKEKIAIHISICAGLYTMLFVGICTLIVDAGFSIRWGVLIAIISSVVISCAICIRKEKTKRFKKAAI